ncbi:insecticidal delta-endotoxin Cry8Ea1 family protein [Bacillus thuringiensis]|uniref:insecticidal delta-endotoxin Cry8Ea1 family protein n=1 Tax=Bacillus thuringiensis TaxID=1428 RepID=UPI0009AB16B8
MKYKDRKNAKRKYKQALLATVATMTLGVSTLGSTASVFAAENTGQTTTQVKEGFERVEPLIQPKIQYANLDPKKIGEAVTGAFDNFTSFILSKQKVAKLDENGVPVRDELGKVVQVSLDEKEIKKIKDSLNKMSKPGAAVLKKAAEGGDGQEILVAYVESLLSMAPYGAFISPLLSMLLPEKKGENIMDQVNKAIDKKLKSGIENYDIAGLNAAFENVEDSVQTAENYLAKDLKGDERRHLTDSMKAKNKALKNFLTVASKKGYEVAELPIYGVAAIAHLGFLKSMSYESARKIAEIPDSVYDAEFTKFKDAAKTYGDHINDTYKMKLVEFEKNMKEAIEDGTNVSSKEVTIDNYKDVLNKAYDEAKNHRTTTSHGSYSSPEEKRMNAITTAIQECDALINELNKYKNLTVNNVALNKLIYNQDTNPNVAVSKWSQLDDGKWYHFNSVGQKDTGWFQDNDKSWYYLGSDGAMVTGWYKYGSSHFYLNDTLKTNYKGETVKKGQMITGWYYNTDNKYYYLKPDNGAMVQNDTIKIDGADARFDENGVWGGGKVEKSSNDKSTRE